MTTPRPSTPSKPLTRGGRVVIWVLVVFIALIGVGGGIALIAEGVNGRAAVADGPVGTLTPTDRECDDGSCWWTGEFVSEDGAITRTGVRLHDAERISRTDPMPDRVDDVRLHDDDRDPVAYTADYQPGPRIAAGAGLLVFCLVVAVLLVRMVRRHTRGAPR